MIAILRFKLPEEQDKFRDACDGWRLRSLLLDFDQYLKERADYADDSNHESPDKHRDHLCALLREYNLEL